MLREVIRLGFLKWGRKKSRVNEPGGKIIQERRRKKGRIANSKVDGGKGGTLTEGSWAKILSNKNPPESGGGSLRR